MHFSVKHRYICLYTSGTNREIVYTCILDEYIKFLNDSPVARNRNVSTNLCFAGIHSLIVVSCLLILSSILDKS